MGASSSTSSVTPILPESFATLTAQQVAKEIEKLGSSYEVYAAKFLEEGVDAAFLSAISTEQLASLFEDLGVESTLHQTKLTVLFQTFKAGTKEAGTVASEQQSRAMDVASAVKAFAAFLSHFKLECGTEARLVQQNLRSILARSPLEGSTTDIFLDSDDLSDL